MECGPINHRIFERYDMKFMLSHLLYLFPRVWHKTKFLKKYIFT